MPAKNNNVLLINDQFFSFLYNGWKIFSFNNCIMLFLALAGSEPVDSGRELVIGFFGKCVRFSRAKKNSVLAH